MDVSHQQDIQIQGPGPVLKSFGAVTTECALEIKQGGEQRLRGKFCFEGDDGVGETGLVGESDGLGGIERRAGCYLAE